MDEIIKTNKTVRFYLQGKEHNGNVKEDSPYTSNCYEYDKCLVAVMSCHDWKIFTIEGIGNPRTQFHLIQETLAKFNGTQCGFCSPGMVMNMYALYQTGKLTMKEVENSFGGNICRCTGYRAILTAFKSLCKDASADILAQCEKIIPDIEDSFNGSFCRKKCSSGEKCDEKKCNKEPFYRTFAGGAKWVKVYSLNDLLATLNTYSTLKYMLIAGNTAKGVYNEYGNIDYGVYIDVSDVKELKAIEIKDDTLVLGANITLNDAKQTFYEISAKNTKFTYLKGLADHIDLIANVPVRNVGTLAGNLTIKHDHHEFPSDIFLTLETVAAKLTIVSTTGKTTVVLPSDFIKMDMSLKVIKEITLPALEPSKIKYESYKIMPRAQNTHAHVNAGFLFKFKDSTTLDSIRIVYGNINPTFVHAKVTEDFLIGKKLFDDSVLQKAFELLDKEVIAIPNPPDPSPEFRKQLAIALFYKGVLSIAPSSLVSSTHKSGGIKLENIRPLSTGSQDYPTNPSEYPLTKPVTKLEALAQTSGQAQYIFDMNDQPDQLCAVLVLAKSAPKSVIKNIDTSVALKVEGIVAFFGKDDIPGQNNFMSFTGYTEIEEIFCSGTVLYYDQPLGVIVGHTLQSVTAAAELVKVTYDKPTSPPLLNVRDVLKSGQKDRIHEQITIVPKTKGDDIKHVVKGTFDIYQQYHFHMETHSCNVIPTEDGLNVFTSTQWMDLNQVAIANMLKIPNNKVNMQVRRCGGGFGGKISRNSLISCAVALASFKLKQSVKMWMTLPHNMVVCGKRWPFSLDYEVGVNDKGVIQYLNGTHYSDLGGPSNENGMELMVDLFMGNYNSDTFSLHVNGVTTDTYTNTWCRAPGSAEGLASIEAIMDHIAYYIKADPLDVRVANITKEKELLKYVADMKSWAEIDKRKGEIATFNKENRWKKKGLSVVPMRYLFEPAGPFTVLVSIFHGDGSVAITHGGIEIGQGINTKTAQVCAYKFGLTLDQISVKPSLNYVTPNSTITGGSVTSEGICYGVIQACDALLDRIKPYRKENQTWQQLISKCFDEFINLSAIGEYSPKSPNVQDYPIYGVMTTEVLLDVLTGNHLITRVDLIEDVGKSMSPEIDIGQVEGAVVMGLGYYTTEKIVYSPEDGKILTNNTWTYLPPGPKDIPVDFRIKFPKDNLNPLGVLNSKAIAEPPLCMTVSVPLAIRNAVASARVDSGPSNPQWYPFADTTSVENVFMNCLNDYKQYTL